MLDSWNELSTAGLSERQVKGSILKWGESLTIQSGNILFQLIW